LIFTFPSLISRPTNNLFSRTKVARLPTLFFALVAMLLVGGAPRVCAQTLGLTASSGGKTVTTVPSGGTVTLIVTGASGQVTFCGTYNCRGTVQSANGTAVFNFVPPPGGDTYQAYLVLTPSTHFSNTASLVVTMANSGKEQATATTIAASGSAGSHTLTGTVVGFVNTVLFPSDAPSPSGTMSFLDTSNANAVLGTAELGVGTNVQSWTACMAPSVDPEPQSIVAADFNDDGISDLAVANLFGPTVTILRERCVKYRCYEGRRAA
jgi:hypothetical protein